MNTSNKDYISSLIESARNDDNSEANKAETIRAWAEEWLDKLFEGFPLEREDI
jgi:hypothetical protein